MRNNRLIKRLMMNVKPSKLYSLKQMNYHICIGTYLYLWYGIIVGLEQDYDICWRMEFKRKKAIGNILLDVSEMCMYYKGPVVM